ncbi:MAG: hypothetical protein JO285_03775 [Kutzneria sp.]|nr:hypothetical protein [Kutzneria sp.]
MGTNAAAPLVSVTTSPLGVFVGGSPVAVVSSGPNDGEGASAAAAPLVSVTTSPLGVFIGGSPADAGTGVNVGTGAGTGVNAGTDTGVNAHAGSGASGLLVSISL